MNHQNKIVFGISAAIVIGAGLLWLAVSRKGAETPLPSTSPSETQATVLPTTPLPTVPSLLPSTLPEIKEVLLQKSKIDFAEPSEVPKASAIGRGALPSDIASLILPDAEKLVIKSVSYAGEKDGYDITYEVAVSLKDTYRQFAALVVPAGWTLLGGYRTDLAAQLELENATTQARISQEKTSDERNQVSIKSIRK